MNQDVVIILTGGDLEASALVLPFVPNIYESRVAWVIYRSRLVASSGSAGSPTLFCFAYQVCRPTLHEDFNPKVTCLLARFPTHLLDHVRVPFEREFHAVRPFSAVPNFAGLDFIVHGQGADGQRNLKKAVLQLLQRLAAANDLVSLPVHIVVTLHSASAKRLCIQEMGMTDSVSALEVFSGKNDSPLISFPSASTIHAVMG